MLRSDTEDPCQILVRRFSIFCDWMLCWLCLSYQGFIMLICVPSVPTLERAFIMNDVDFYQMVFLHLLRWSCVFVFSFVDVVYWSVYFEPSLQPWDESNLIVVYDLLFMYCIMLAKFFFICNHQRYWPVIFFTSSNFVWFWPQCDDSFIEWFEKYSLLLKLLEEFEKNQYMLFTCFIEFSSKVIWSWTFFCSNFFFFNYWFYLFISFISSWFSFDGLYVSETSPFLLDCLICWHIMVHSIPLFVFLISAVSIVTSPL